MNKTISTRVDKLWARRRTTPQELVEALGNSRNGERVVSVPPWPPYADDRIGRTHERFS